MAQRGMKEVVLTKQQIAHLKKMLEFQDRICKEMCPLKEGENACPMICCILNRNKVIKIWDKKYWEFS